MFDRKRQIVPFVKPILSRDAVHALFYTPDMRDMDIDFARESLFNEQFCSRIQELRKARGWTQDQMASALGVPKDRYKKYEIRSPLPAYLIEPFSHIVGKDIVFVLTGRPDQRKPAISRQEKNVA